MRIPGSDRGPAEPLRPTGVRPGVRVWVAAVALLAVLPHGAAAQEPAPPAMGALAGAFALLSQGRVEEGRRALLDAAPELVASKATAVIQLAALLARATPEGAALAAAQAPVAWAGQGVEAARAVAEGVHRLPPGDAPPLLAQAARWADEAGAHDLALDLREELLAAFPGEPEAGEAALAAARRLASSPEGRERAVRLLEDLLARTPGSAVSPDARRELERLGRGG